MNSGQELTPDGFRQIDCRYLFVAGSEDVARQRAIAYTAAQDALQELGQDDVQVFAWDVETGPDGLDQRRSMQKNLPRPSGENCLGLIYLVGERIGLPLEESVEPGIIAQLNDWTDPTNYFRLEPEWPEGQLAGDELLKSGAFPLTGGVFEFLDAHGAGKPVWLGLCAEEAVTLGGKDIELNKRWWLNSKTYGLDRDALSIWVNGEYWRQTQGVYNLMRALARRGIDQHPTATDVQLKERIKAFVGAAVFKTSGGHRNPYRHLGYYDIGDGADFYGRDEFTAIAVKTLEARFSSGPAVLRLVGPSGSGKSSLLRAGILHSLRNPKLRGRYRVAALRPEDFKDEAGQPMPLVTVLLQAVSEQAHVNLPAAGIFAVAKRGAAAPAAAAALISRALTESDPFNAVRLVIGLDQFEEILDVLGGGLSGEQWQPLVQFVSHAAKTPNIGIIYTLESSRIQAHDDLSLGEAFEGAAVLELDDPRTFIHTIIDRPFRLARFPLADDVITALTNNLYGIKKQQAQQTWAEGAVLPLLALKLTQLFDFVSERFEPRNPGVRAEFGGAGRDDGQITVQALASEKEDLGFKQVIERQAELAWRRSGAGPLSPLALEYFLQPFVGVDSERIQLTSAPNDPPYEDERKLAASFRKYRLLIGAGNGLLRLVHEAVLQYWPAAKAWYEARLAFLVTKAKLRKAAEAWAAFGRPDVQASAQNDPMLIGQAAAILRAYLRHWSLDLENLQSEDRVLYEYLSAVFQFSGTPGEIVDSYPEPATHHAGLAASYGLVELLEKFRIIDPACLDSPTPRQNDGNWARPLHHAAWAQPKAVKYLLSHGVDPVSKSGLEWPAIAGAVHRGVTAAFFPLIEAASARAAPDPLEDVLSCPGGRTLLHLCASSDQAFIARNLIDRYGFSPLRKDDSGWLPLHYAAYSGCAGVFDLFRNYSGAAEQTNGGAACLHLASQAGKTLILDRILASHDADKALAGRDQTGKTALHYAAEYLQAECVAELCRYMDPRAVDNNGEQPFHCLFPARQADKENVDQDRLVETLKALLADDRSDPNAKVAAGSRKGETPLSLARYYPRVQQVLLEDSRTALTEPVPGSTETAFFTALRLGVWRAVRRYIELDPLHEGQIVGQDGNTILHLLARRTAPLDLADRQLASLPAERINARNKEGETPLMRAMAAGNWPLAIRILETGRVTLDFGPAGFPHEIFAALKSDAPAGVLEMLIEFDPDVVGRLDRLGWTLLHRICAHNQPLWLERLKPHIAGRDNLWRRTDKMGRRPIDLCNEEMRIFLGNPAGAAPLPAAVTWDSHIAWARFPRNELAVLEKQLRSERSFSTVDGLEDGLAAVRVDRGVLSFYKEAELLRIVSPKWTQKDRSLYYIRVSDRLFRLNGSSAPIHEINSVAPLVLTIGNALDYLRFFCFFLRTKEGPFLIAESPDQRELPGNLSAPDRAKIARLAHPSWLVDEHDNAFYAVGLVYYGTELSGAEFEMQKTGEVKIVNEFIFIPDFARLDGAPIV